MPRIVFKHLTTSVEKPNTIQTGKFRLGVRRFSDSKDAQKKEEKSKEENQKGSDDKKDPPEEQNEKEETTEQRRKKLTRIGFERFQREHAKLQEFIEDTRKKGPSFPWGLLTLCLFAYLFHRLTKGEEIDWNYFRHNYLMTGRVSRLVVQDKRKVYIYGPDILAREFFYIENVEWLERELEDTQFALGIPLINLIPVDYVYTTTYTRDAILNTVGIFTLFYLSGLGTQLLMGLMQFTWRWNRTFRVPTIAEFSDSTKLVRKHIEEKQKQIQLQSQAPKTDWLGRPLPPQKPTPPTSPSSTSSLFTKPKIVTFQDVAGQKEAKQEISEFVDFLKNPAYAKRLGARLPRGALLTGPPGTGKTLLAKATAGEAGVPFHAASGSDFVERYVGMGALRVRQLFAKAKEKTPCIIWIDEIDSVARARSSGSFRNEEREQTLNQLLVELDGFSTDEDVIVFAGTNRPDLLDPALLRPGRFDRKVTLVLPDLEGRKEISMLYLKTLKLFESVELVAEHLAVHSPGMSGADIANVCNEAAIIAARRNKKFVTLDEINEALDRVQGGIEQRGKRLDDKERRVVAYHEAGHAIVGWYMKHVDPLIKLSIVPRGLNALGFAQYQPIDRQLYTTNQLYDRMCMTLGGRAAEKIFFEHMSTGAADDLSKVSQMAYSQVVHYGMGEKVGLLSWDLEKSSTIDLPYSQKTAQLIDEEVREIVQDQSRRAEQIVREKEKEIRLLAEELLVREVLSRDDITSLLGPRPVHDKVKYDELSEQTQQQKDQSPHSPTH